MTVREFLEVAGRRIEVARLGPAAPDAPTLVFLHEGLGCAAMWRDFPAALAAATGCGALVYSRFGHGRSAACALPRPIGYMHDEALEVLPALLEAAAVERAILVGHSDGGSIALIHTGGRAAAGLCGVITEAAHLFVEAISIRAIEAARRSYEQGSLRRNLAKYHGDNTDCAFRGWNGVWLDPEFRDWNIEAYLPKIRVPVLAIQGADDNYGTTAQLDAIARLAGAETELLADCGHAPHRDRRAATLRAMAGFIGRLVEERLD